MDKDEKKLLEIKIREQIKVIPVLSVIVLLCAGFQIALFLILCSLILEGIAIGIVSILLAFPLYRRIHHLMLVSVRKKYKGVLKI
jgi:hypothetical protein